MPSAVVRSTPRHLLYTEQKRRSLDRGIDCRRLLNTHDGRALYRAKSYDEAKEVVEPYVRLLRSTTAAYAPANSSKGPESRLEVLFNGVAVSLSSVERLGCRSATHMFELFFAKSFGLRCTLPKISVRCGDRLLCLRKLAS
jgi:hypothetical protein